MTEKYRELNLALEFLDAIDTTELSEENAGNVIEAHGYLSTWLEDNTELPQQFEVGEYKVCGTTKNVYKVDENPLTEMKPTKFYVAHENRFVKMTLHEKVIARDEKATAEQIAEFKLAEIKNDIGLIIKNGDGDWIEIVEDIEEYLAEELEGVE